MLSKIAFTVFLISHLVSADNPLALLENTVNPIEALFGSGYVCLHISDPQFESSPSFQALARELAKKYNKTPIVHKVGSNETDHPHPHGPDTVHYGVDVTTGRPPIASLIKRKALKCTKPGLFSNPNNCTKFYQCVEGGKGKPFQKVEFDCGPGTIFDESISACNHPAAVNPKPDCWESDEFMKGLRGQSRSTTTPQPEIEEVYTAPDESDEDDQVPQLPQLPEPIPTGKPPPAPLTDEGQIEQHPEPPPFPVQEPENPCHMPGLFGDANNCSIYFQCIRSSHGKYNMIWRTCHGEEIFDAEEEECRHYQDVNPKPACWDRHKRKRQRVVIDEYEEITKDYQAPEESVESIEHFDEFESSGTTQSRHTPGSSHTKKTSTTTITEEVDENGVPIPSGKLKAKKRRVRIRRPDGPKPIPKCTMEGIIPHPTDCSKYIKCKRQGSRPLKLYRYPCSPAGTVFDATTNECRKPEDIKPMPPAPDCASWDDDFRPIFEDILTDAVEEEEPETEKPPVVDEDEYEEVIVDDGKGGTRVVRRRKVVTSTIEEEITEGEDEPSHHLSGKKTTHHTKEDGIHHEEQEPEPAPYQESTTTPPPRKVPPPPEREVEEVFSMPDEDDTSCDDEKDLIERLTRERDEAQTHSAELEKKNAKMEYKIKKLMKEVAAAKKDKIKYEKYIASLDKTIDAYKEEVAWYLQHCPQPTEFIEDEYDTGSIGVKHRKRRSLDTSFTPVDGNELSGRGQRSMENYVEDIHSKKDEVRKHRQSKPRPIHVTSESVDDGSIYNNSPFILYDEIGDGEPEPDSRHRRNHHFQEDKSMTSEDRWGNSRHHHSPHHTHERSAFFSQLPLLIFTILSVILITITILGYMLVRRLFRMTTFSLMPEDFENETLRRKLVLSDRLGKV